MSDELKAENGKMDDTINFWALMDQVSKKVPDITLEELRQFILIEMFKLYKSLKGVDDLSNLHRALNYLNELIDEFEGVVKLNVSENWKKER